MFFTTHGSKPFGELDEIKGDETDFTPLQDARAIRTKVLFVLEETAATTGP